MMQNIKKESSKQEQEDLAGQVARRRQEQERRQQEEGKSILAAVSEKMRLSVASHDMLLCFSLILSAHQQYYASRESGKLNRREIPLIH